MDVIAPLLAAGVMSLLAAAQGHTHREAAARTATDRAHAQAAARAAARRATRPTSRRPSPARVWARAEATGWHHQLDTGALQPVGEPVPDPGNPGNHLLLAEHPAGDLGPIRVLLATNPADPDHPVALAVPARFTDPIAAAAWTYHDPTHPLATTPDTYTALTRRT
jgi:hypothetical protein